MDVHHSGFKARGVFSRLAANEFLPPKHKIQKEPGISPSPGTEQTQHGIAVEKVRLIAERRQLPLREFAKLLEKPFVNGHPKALLSTIDDFIGNKTANGFLEDML